MLAIAKIARMTRKQRIKRQSKLLALGTVLAILFLGLIACQKTPQTTTKSTGMPGEGVKVRSSAHGATEDSRFIAEIVNIALERLGYKIPESIPLNPTARHLALGNGDIDFSPIHWEKLHTEFFAKSGGEEKLERVGEIVSDLWQGYQIDRKTAAEYNITNLAQLKDPKIAQLFDSDGDGKANLVGCNPGWGCELVIEHHLDAYGLRDTVEHDQGEYLALLPNTIARYRQGKPVLYYTWTPLWLASVLKPESDVVWLEVPFTSLPAAQKGLTEKDTSVEGKNLGFAVDRIRFVANKEFLAANPAAKRLFELVQIPIEDLNAENQLIYDGEDTPEEIRRHAQEWIKKNQELFDRWLEEAKVSSQ